jgi:hypothetical protein
MFIAVVIRKISISFYSTYNRFRTVIFYSIVYRKIFEALLPLMLCVTKPQANPTSNSNSRNFSISVLFIDLDINIEHTFSNTVTYSVRANKMDGL